MKLFRAMAAELDGSPSVARSARALGIRTALEFSNGGEPDVTVTADDDIILPGTGGMSVAPVDPVNLPPFRRPPLFGGKGKDPVWEIDAAELGPELQFRQDRPKHGLIEPARPMTLKEFESALAATRPRWTQHTSKVA